eukprot:9503847-Pyramimonas_sp.AAC.1
MGSWYTFTKIYAYHNGERERCGDVWFLTRVVGFGMVAQINAEEVLALTGAKDVPAAAAICFEKYLSPSAYLAVTDGPSAAHLYSSAGVWTYGIPKIE